ncbi:MAG: efflux RND transporter periplasmic adaptor subunit [Desulfobacteraceae bacterium]|nr:efflux RND transporter periplasmic adaptor subunit [Desulfobacteraceae bacterium]
MKTDRADRSRARGRASGLAALILALLLVWGCGADDSEKDGQQGPDSGSCVKVDRARVKTADLEEIIGGIGSIEAFQSVQVYPEVSGIIETVEFEEGARVEKGQLLFTIDDAKIRAELNARQAALEETRANLENARLVFQRRQRLYKQKLGTEEARDEARTRYQALSAQVKRIQAEIENIRETLKDTRIRAPFDGFAGAHHVDAGQLVDTETQLTSVVQADRLKIRFTVPERHMGRVRVGQQIRISVPAYPEEKFPGTIYFIDPQLDPGTRSLRIQAQADNPEDLLRPGGFASVELIAGTREGVLTIPEEALIPTRSGYMVFIIENGRARGREVKIGLRRPGIVEITSGLEEGETIVRAGHISLYEGAQVCPE